MHLLLLPLFFLISVSSVAGSSGLLDGRKFEGIVTEEGKTKGDKDTITVEAGQFVSEACVPYGFGKAPYLAKKWKAGITLHVEVPSSKHKDEKLVWDGVVKGNVLTGKMVWMKNGKSTNYSVEAKEK